MPYAFTLTTTLPASAQEIYDAWLDSLAHSEMTGGAATSADDEAGARPQGTAIEPLQLRKEGERGNLRFHAAALIGSRSISTRLNKPENDDPLGPN